MKTKSQIEETIADCKKSIKEMEKIDNHEDFLIFQGWVEALEYVLKDDSYDLNDKEKKALRDFECDTEKETGVSMISGGFAIAEVYDEDDFYDENKDKVHEFYKVQLKWGVQSDCTDRVNTEYYHLHKETLRFESL